MALRRNMVAEKRNYAVQNVESAKKIATIWINSLQLEKVVDFGLPEVDDRYHIWRVPLISKSGSLFLGEVVIDARTSLIDKKKTTEKSILEARLLGRNNKENNAYRKTKEKYNLSNLRNIIALGDAETILQELPSESIDLVFTSPPYYNARPEYSDYITYEDYLLKMRKIIQNTHHILAEGRFFVLNISPVLIRRASRNESSKRIAVPFDMHRIFIEEGFDFIDDIIWVKPEGAGWALGRGRRFAADRNPLQYKPVTVTENVLVYRKRTEKLIDWNIRAHPNPELVKESRINDDYDRTNLWYIKPAHNKDHPAIFPVELAEKVIKYYSFKNDVVLDPFAGIGTVGEAAVNLKRRFVLIEIEPRFIDIIRKKAKTWMGKSAADILTINCPPIDVSDKLV